MTAMPSFLVMTLGCKHPQFAIAPSKYPALEHHLERKSGNREKRKGGKASWSLGVKNEGKGKWKKKSWRSILDEAQRNRGSEQISTACLLLGHAKCDGLVSVMPAQLVSSSLGERASRIFKQQPVAILLDARFRVNDAAFTPQNHMTDY